MKIEVVEQFDERLEFKNRVDEKLEELEASGAKIVDVKYSIAPFSWKVDYSAMILYEQREE